METPGGALAEGRKDRLPLLSPASRAPRAPPPAVSSSSGSCAAVRPLQLEPGGWMQAERGGQEHGLHAAPTLSLAGGCSFSSQAMAALSFWLYFSLFLGVGLDFGKQRAL